MSLFSEERKPLQRVGVLARGGEPPYPKGIRTLFVLFQERLCRCCGLCWRHLHSITCHTTAAPLVRPDHGGLSHPLRALPTSEMCCLFMAPACFSSPVRPLRSPRPHPLKAHSTAWRSSS